jgi:hypothetical protein
LTSSDTLKKSHVADEAHTQKIDARGKMWYERLQEFPDLAQVQDTVKKKMFSMREYAHKFIDSIDGHMDY